MKILTVSIQSTIHNIQTWTHTAEIPEEGRRKTVKTFKEQWLILKIKPPLMYDDN